MDLKELWKTHIKRMRKLKKELDLTEEKEHELKIRKTSLAKDVADLRSRTEIPEIEESLDKAFLSLISYNNVRRDLLNMKPYYKSVLKAYKANDTGTLRTLVNSNKYELEQELLTSMKRRLTNVEQAYDAIERDLLDLDTTLLDLDATLTNFIEPNLTESEFESVSDFTDSDSDFTDLDSDLTEFESEL